LDLADRDAVKVDTIKLALVVQIYFSRYLRPSNWTEAKREQRHPNILDSDIDTEISPLVLSSRLRIIDAMASPTMLTRLVLLVSLLLLGVFAVEHAAPDDPKTSSKRQTSASGYPTVFVRNSNLWVAYSSHDEKQLTMAGTPENPFDEDNIYLSPNKNFAVAWQYTPAQDHSITLIESSPPVQ
jgi:hypothetical protein